MAGSFMWLADKAIPATSFSEGLRSRVECLSHLAWLSSTREQDHFGALRRQPEIPGTKAQWHSMLEKLDRGHAAQSLKSLVDTDLQAKEGGEVLVQPRQPTLTQGVEILRTFVQPQVRELPVPIRKVSRSSTRTTRIPAACGAWKKSPRIPGVGHSMTKDIATR